MSQPAIVADVIDTWKRRAMPKRGKALRTICFATNRRHAKLLRDSFEEAGVRAAYMDGNTPLDTRDEIKAEFHTHKIDIVINVGVLILGIDWHIECLILAMRTLRKLSTSR
jgi:DNA repair protein RadD